MAKSVAEFLSAGKTAAAPGGSKYSVIADRLREAVMEFPPGTKFPSARETAKLFGVSLISAHRALSLLRGEGLISAGKGRGGSVTTPRRAASPVSFFNGDVPLKASVFIQSGYPTFMRHWEKVREDFRASRGGPDFEFRIYHKLPGEPAPLTEINSYQWPDFESSPKWLKLSGPGSIDGKEASFFPCQLHAPCVILNLDFLARLGMGAAADPGPWENFGDMADWAARLEDAMRKKHGRSRAGFYPCWNLQTHSGLWLEFYSRAGKTAPPDWLKARFGLMRQTAGTLPPDGPDCETAELMFVKGAVPFLGTFTHAVNDMIAARNPAFRWRALPAPDFDGMINCAVTGMVIQRDQPFAPESARFARMLQAEESQEFLRGLGLIPYFDSGKPLVIRGSAGFERKKLRPVTLGSEREKNFLSRVFLPEASHFLSGRESFDALVENCLSLIPFTN